MLWLLASIALRIYLYFFDTYSLTYGSLGAVITLMMLWFYLKRRVGAYRCGDQLGNRRCSAREGAPDAKRKGETAPGELRPARG